MHMADALISPVVGATLWVAAGTTLTYCSRTLRQDRQERLVPLMGVLGAFVFAAQMINFSIPATGSSGHLGGGLLLAILLGPPAAFVVIASVLAVQALFLGDGGLLALGANICNLGLFPCFVGYLLIFRPLLGANLLCRTSRRISVVTVLAAIISLQLGAFSVVMITLLSGISSLPFSGFLLLMQPIHLAIGLAEGLATAAIVLFLQRARPDLFSSASRATSINPLLAAFGFAAACIAGVGAWFASTLPDGLEWSIAHAGGRVEPTNLAAAWPAVDAGTSLEGILGAAATLSLILGFGFLLRLRHKS